MNSNINTAINKANRILGITRRTFECLDQTSFKLLYKGMVRPQLEYGAPIWSPHLIKYKELIENVQRRATKLIPGFYDLPYPERIKKLEIPTLAYRRVRGDMIQVYKILNDKYDPSLPKLLNTFTGITRGQNKLYIECPKRDLRKYTFTIR